MQIRDLHRRVNRRREVQRLLGVLVRPGRMVGLIIGGREREWGREFRRMEIRFK